MANEDNLIPNSERTPSERRENARKAGKASGEARRKKADMRKLAKMILDGEHSDKNSGKTYTGNEAIVLAMFAAATDPKSRNMMQSINKLQELSGQDKTPEEKKRIKLELEIKQKELELLQKKIENMDW